MKMSFFIWHIYYYRAFCTVTNDDFADGNLLSHPSAYFGIPTMYLLLFFLLTTSWPSYLFWFCISFTFLSHFFPTCSTLSLLVQLVQTGFCDSLRAAMRAPAAPTSRTGPLPPPSYVYLSKLQNVFVCQAKLICSDLMLQANQKIS